MTRRTTRAALSVEALEGRDVPSSASPYVVPANPAVTTQALLTVGDSVNLKPDGVTPYRAVGIMDGMGAYDNGDGTFTLVMNHELPVGVSGAGVATPVGVARAHGNAGAFVSRWTIESATLKVLKVEDLLPTPTSIFLSNNDPGTGAAHTGYLPADTTILARLCSADLAAPGAYGWTDPATGVFYGTTARIFQTGEESGGIATAAAPGGDLGPEARVDFGRQWNMILTDDPNIPGDQARTAYEMPHCGLFPWENNLASPFAQRLTITAGMDDSTGGQIYFWVGEKQTTGNVVERAGLTRQSAADQLYVLRVDDLVPDATGATNEVRDVPLSGRFSLRAEGDVSGLTLAGLEAKSDSVGGTQFFRPEDGQWDPRNPNDYYFVTTDQYDQVKDGVGTTVSRSRLYRLRFDDITNPAAGGTIEALLDGTEAGNMFDNMTVDTHGRVIIQEDVGNQAHNSKVWMYETATDRLVLLAQHDPARFGDLTTPPTAPFSRDEESSGVIDVSDIVGRPGTFLLNVQAHYNVGDPELVEGGQLLAMTVPVPATAGGVRVNDGSAQRSKVNAVTVTLNGVIPAANIAADAFTLTRVGGGTFTAAVTAVTPTADGNTLVTLAFAGPGVRADGALPDGRYRLSVDGSAITDRLGQALDSDRDGVAGGPVVQVGGFHALFGDSDGDADVDVFDLFRFLSAVGPTSASPRYLAYFDFDADGDVALTDTLAFVRRLGRRI